MENTAANTEELTKIEEKPEIVQEKIDSEELVVEAKPDVKEASKQQATIDPDEECDVPDEDAEGFDSEIKNVMQRKTMQVRSSQHQIQETTSDRKASDFSIEEQEQYHIISK